MDINQHIEYWLKSASHDLDVAKTLFQNQQHDWCLFIGHLVLEKTLKAFFVRDNQGAHPFTHNLLRLAENTKLHLSEEQLLLLADVNNFHVEARYPDFKFTFYKTCTKEFTEEYFNKIQEIYKWLLSQMK